MSVSILKEAARLQRAGIPIIPCYLATNGKKPPIKDFPVNPGEINPNDALRALQSGANYFGVFPCAAPGLYCIDIDSKNAQTAEQKADCEAVANVATEAGLYVETSINGGFHVFFYSAFPLNFPELTNIGRQLFQVKGGNVGGYIVVSPCPGYAVLSGTTLDKTGTANEAVLSGFKAVLSRYARKDKPKDESPAKPAKTANFEPSHSRGFVKKANDAFTEALAYLRNCKDGENRKGTIPAIAGKVGFFADALGGLDYCTEAMIAARKANKESESIDFHTRLISENAANGFQNWQRINANKATTTPTATVKGATESVTQTVTPTATKTPTGISETRGGNNNGATTTGGISIEKHIGTEQWDLVFDEIQALKPGQSITIQAPAGSGKSYGAIMQLLPKVIHDSMSMFFFVCPFDLQVRQIEKKHTVPNPRKPKDYQPLLTIALSGGKNMIDINADQKPIAYACTYDMLASKLGEAKDNIETGYARGIVLIVDESHLLTQSYGFRRQAISNIQKFVRETGGKVVYISATPDNERPTTKTLIFEAAQAPLCDLTVKLYKPIPNVCRRVDFFFHAVMEAAKEAKTDRPLIVRLNHKTMQSIFAAALIKEGIASKDEIGFVMSLQDKTERSELRDFITDKSRIPAGLKVVFVTSIFDQAINIESDISRVLILPVIHTDFDAALLVQLYNRFREMKAVPVTLLWPENRIEDSEKYAPAKTVFKDVMRKAASAAAKLNAQNVSGESIKDANIGTLRGAIEHAEHTEKDGGFYAPSENSALYAAYEKTAMYQGVGRYLNTAGGFIPAGKLQWTMQDADTRNYDTLAQAESKARNDKDAMKAAILESIAGKEAAALGYIAKTTGDRGVKKAIEKLGFSPCDMPENLAALCADFDLEIEAEILKKTLADYAKNHTRLAEHGFKADDTRALMQGTKKAMGEAVDLLELYFAMYAYDYTLGFCPALADLIENQDASNRAAQKIRRAVGTYLENSIEGRRSLEAERIEAMKARLESEKSTKAAKTRQTLKAAIERLEAAPLGTYRIKINDLDIPSELRRDAFYFLTEICGGIETRQSESSNGKEAEVYAPNIGHLERAKMEALINIYTGNGSGASILDRKERELRNTALGDERNLMGNTEAAQVDDTPPASAPDTYFVDGIEIGGIAPF